MTEQAPRRLYDKPVRLHHGDPYGANLRAAEQAAQDEADRLSAANPPPPWWVQDIIDREARKARKAALFARMDAKQAAHREAAE